MRSIYCPLPTAIVFLRKPFDDRHSVRCNLSPFVFSRLTVTFPLYKEVGEK